MNASFIVIIASVLFLGGCIQNESRRMKDVQPAQKTEKPALPDRSGKPSLPEAASAPTGETSTRSAQSGGDGSLPEATRSTVPATLGENHSQETEEDSSENAPVPSGLAANGTRGSVLSDVKTADKPAIVSSNTGNANKPLSLIQRRALINTQKNKTPAENSKIREQKAYQDFLKPLFEKIRKSHAATAERFEAQLDQSLPLNKAEYDQADPAAQANLLLTGVLQNLAQTKPAPSQNIATQFLLNTQRLNRRMIYEYLRHARLDVSDWKFEQLDSIQAQSELIRIALRKMSLIGAKPEGEFRTRQATEEHTNCQINITYEGIEKGVRIQVSEPRWDEFDLHFNPQNGVQTVLHPSMAGDEYLALEILEPMSDGSKLRFSLSYRKDPKNALSERAPDHLVLEKLPAQGGAAEKVLMCRLMDTMLGDLPEKTASKEEKN